MRPCRIQNLLALASGVFEANRRYEVLEKAISHKNGSPSMPHSSEKPPACKIKKTGSARLHHNWRMLRKTLNLGLCQARYDYINDMFGDVRSNPKPFWKLIAAQRKDS